MFKLSLEKEKTLSEKMHRLGIRQEDIRENFIRSSAPGGQNVNKVASCVYLKHIPSGIEVKCQRERSQVLNRYLARELLIAKIEAVRLKKIAQTKQLAEKIRRQKRRKSQSAKQRILEYKRKHSQKKAFRAKVRDLD